MANTPLNRLTRCSASPARTTVSRPAVLLKVTGPAVTNVHQLLPTCNSSSSTSPRTALTHDNPLLSWHAPFIQDGNTLSACKALVQASQFIDGCLPRIQGKQYQTAWPLYCISRAALLFVPNQSKLAGMSYSQRRMNTISSMLVNRLVYNNTSCR